jgi:hypothetical protein
MGQREPLVLIKECAIDHLTILGKLSKEKREELELKEPYDLFVEMYQSIDIIIQEHNRSRVTKDFDAFKCADEELWKHGHAMMGFAIAEALGWLKNWEIMSM